MDPSEEIRRRIAAPPPPTEETVRRFVRSFWHDADGSDDVERDLERTAGDERGRHYLVTGADAIDALLADPPAENRLMELVSIDANRPLERNTDEVAAEWLRAFAERVRAVVARV
jgi:hypothetical protein